MHTGIYQAIYSLLVKARRPAGDRTIMTSLRKWTGGGGGGGSNGELIKCRCEHNNVSIPPCHDLNHIGLISREKFYVFAFPFDHFGYTAMHSLRLQRLLWIYCPGHPGVSGNERAGRLASTADITSGLQLGRAEVIRDLRNFLNTDRPMHHSTDRLKERGVEKGSGRHSTLQGRERSVFNQTSIGTVSRATLGRLLRDGTEHVWAFPSATMPS